MKPGSRQRLKASFPFSLDLVLCYDVLVDHSFQFYILSVNMTFLFMKGDYCLEDIN